jgi:uncharacterized protein (DUF924 family)
MTHVPGDWIAEILHFWFNEIPREAWFRKDEAFDRRVRERFLARYEHFVVLPVAHCVRNADTAMVCVIVLDQFPRNMFRGTPRAFATDAKAREIADRAIANGFEAALSKDQRSFLYLPYQHAENAVAQARGVELMAKLDDAELSRWALAHRDIIERFGRFPHRNDVLGRMSTAAEIAFLAQPGSSF